MKLYDWEHNAIDELERDYNRLSEEAKEAFHDAILQWNIHPGWVVLSMFVMGFLIGKFVL